MAKGGARAGSKVAFELWTESAGLAFDRMISEARDLVFRLKASGVATSEIMARIERMVEEDEGFVATFKGALQNGMNDLTSTEAQVESNVVFDPEELLEWVLDPTAKEHCDDCVALAQEEPKLLADWEAIGLPGIGNTICDGYCKCTLMPAGVGE